MRARARVAVMVSVSSRNISRSPRATLLWQLGDWIFAVLPFIESPIDDEAYFCVARSRGITDESISGARRMKVCVPRFLELAVTEILSGAPRLVGFSTVFQQNGASLVLAKMLKMRDSSLTIVFGGGNCDGPMGAALHKSFPWVDVVVRGEGERAIVEIAEDMLAGRSIRARPGLCYRRDGESIATDHAREATSRDFRSTVSDLRRIFFAPWRRGRVLKSTQTARSGSPETKRAQNVKVPSPRR
jgi:hypothetical protein